jgi:hypothetical protein
VPGDISLATASNAMMGSPLPMGGSVIEAMRGSNWRYPPCAWYEGVQVVPRWLAF